MRFKPVVQGEHVFSVKVKHPIASRPNLAVGDRLYHLVGVLVHAGESANSGHYYFTTVCPPYHITGRAYRSNNDDEPVEISQDQLVADIYNGYMLVYQLAEDQPMQLASAVTVPSPPVVNEERPASAGEKSIPTAAPTAGRQQERGGLQADGTPIGNGTGPIPTPVDNGDCPEEEEKGRRGVQANEEEQGLPATSDVQQRGRGLPSKSPFSLKKGSLSSRASAEHAAQRREGAAFPQSRGDMAATSVHSPPEASQENEVEIGAGGTEAPASSKETPQPDASSNSDSTVTEKGEEEKFKEWVRNKEAIRVIPPAQRTPEEQSQYRRYGDKIKKLAWKFPHIPLKPLPKTSAERKANQRQDEDKREKEREKDRARKATVENKEKDSARHALPENREKDRAKKATDEYLEKDRGKKASQRQNEEYREKEKEDDRARKATDAYKAADLQRKTAKKAGVTFKARDGLKSELTLTGKFGVPVNFLGAMDQVSVHSYL